MEERRWNRGYSAREEERGGRQRETSTRWEGRRRESRWEEERVGSRAASSLLGNGGGGGQRAEAIIIPPEAGEVRRGVVTRVASFGIFVRLEEKEGGSGGGRLPDGLIHWTEVSADLHFTREDGDEERIKALEYMGGNAGESVFVKVLEVNREGGGGRFKISCSMRVVSQEDGKPLGDDELRAREVASGRESDELPQLGTVHRATVEKIMPYGVFMHVRGFKRNALVHPKQVSGHLETNRDDSDDAKIAALAEVVAVGEELWVKIVEVKEASEMSQARIGASIKMVSQSDGVDLDPNMTGNYGRQGRRGDHDAMQKLGASVGELKSDGKIDWGHMATLRQMGGKQYDIVVDEEELMEERVNAEKKTTQQKQLELPEGRRRGMPPPPPPRPPPPPAHGMGRGMGSTKPAWMTEGGGGGGGGRDNGRTPIGSGGGGGEGGGGSFLLSQDGPIQSVEEARAIISEYRRQKRRKEKKEREERRRKSRDRDREKRREQKGSEKKKRR